MKVRQGFVSNSSSSSFVLGKYFMTDEQIKEFSDWIKEMEMDETENGFYDSYIHESKHYFTSTIENCDADKVEVKLQEMGIDKDKYSFNC